MNFQGFCVKIGILCKSLCFQPSKNPHALYLRLNFLTTLVKLSYFAYIVLQDGSIIHSEVRAFLKQHFDILKIYLSITTSCGITVKISENHLIYGRKGHAHKFKPV